MNRREFERHVAEALEKIPDALRKHIANVAIVVEEWPDAETMEYAEVDDPLDLLGFYHGIPLTERTSDYGLVPPDKISIYRQSILATCRNDAEARDVIHTTLRHEIAHYFGIDDERLEEMGRY
ncbi:MAG: metallopeptidase family protein [Chloroflexi bacterium]|nr:metallopeptidase family protein [Chloroflexota bacterium]